MNLNLFELSIVAVFYNESLEHIKRCINSLLNVDYNNKYEILVINNNQDEEYILILEEYISSISNFEVKLFHSKINKIANARKLGWLNSRGKWITFVDGDDYFLENWAKDFFDFSRTLYDNNKPVIISSNLLIDDINKNKRYIYSYDDLYSSTFFLFGGSFFMKDYFKEECFFQKEQWAEDLYMNLMYVKINDPKILNLNRIIYKYCKDDFEEKHVGSIIGKIKSEIFYLDKVYGNTELFYKYLYLFSTNFVFSLINSKLKDSWKFSIYLKKFKKKNQKFCKLNFFYFSSLFLFPLSILCGKIIYYIYNRINGRKND